MKVLGHARGMPSDPLPTRGMYHTLNFISIKS